MPDAAAASGHHVAAHDLLISRQPLLAAASWPAKGRGGRVHAALPPALPLTLPAPSLLPRSPRRWWSSSGELSTAEDQNGGWWVQIDREVVQRVVRIC
jgi:hypothetical protein